MSAPHTPEPVGMTPDEMRPRDGEKFYPWLARVDAPTFAYAQREHHSKEEMEANRRGFLEGQYALLFHLYEALDRGVTDAALLVRMMAAGMIALKRRRSHLDFRGAFEHHMHVLTRLVDEPPTMNDADVDRERAIEEEDDGSPAA